MRFILHTVFPPEMCLLPPQCWATRILKHWDHCDTQINIGEGEIDTSVSRFLTSIVFSLKRGKSNSFCSMRIFGWSMESTCLVRTQKRKRNVGCRNIFQLYLKKIAKDGNKGIKSNVLHIQVVIKTCGKMWGRWLYFTFWRHIFQLFKRENNIYPS